MKGVLAVSGWGLDHRFFSPLEMILAGTPFRHLSWMDIPRFPGHETGGWTLLAHSLGAFEVLSRLRDLPFAGAVLCSVGTNFAKAPGGEGFGVAPRVLTRMVDGMAGDPEGVLSAFHGNMFAPEPVDPAALPVSAPATEGLIQGLLRLRDVHCRYEADPSIPYPVEIVHGEGDRILDGRTAHALAGKTGWPLTVIPGAGHGFPFTRPSSLADILRRVGNR